MYTRLRSQPPAPPQVILGKVPIIGCSVHFPLYTGLATLLKNNEPLPILYFLKSTTNPEISGFVPI